MKKGKWVFSFLIHRKRERCMVGVSSGKGGEGEGEGEKCYCALTSK